MSACEDVRMSLGVYMLGALEADEAVQVEAHLATCPECRAELEELSGLTALLGRVSEEDIEQAASPPHAVLDRLISASARRHRLNRVVFGLAASLVAVVLGGSAWLAVGRSPGTDTSMAGAPAASSAQGSADQSAEGLARRSEPFAATPGPSAMLKDQPLPSRSPVSASNSNGPIRAELALTPGDEGTAVEIVLSGVPTGTSCRVTAVGIDGTQSPVGSWTVDAADYRRGPSTFTGSTELTMDRIRGFDIRASTGRRLVWVKAP
ncbi:zf-HC2 domain-containing protein [Sphaerisporangium sp. NPDC049002]|uniref:zf-HC2 domain-containing protein n=1 Tax=unclassified Sphaerisporangium TaxID=2630420 RepID=UPI00340B8093